MSDTGSKARHETLRERLAFFGFARTKVFASPIENWELGAQMVTLATNPGTSDYAAYCDRVEQTLAPFERAYHLGLREQQGFDDGFGHGASAMKRAAWEAVASAPVAIREPGVILLNRGEALAAIDSAVVEPK